MDIDRKIILAKKVVISLFIVLIVFWIFKAIIQQDEQKIPLPKVVISHPKTKKIVEYVTQTGTMVAYQSVDLVARVEGFLEKQGFIDGSFVEKGRELFVIEPELYLEKLKSANAELAGRKASYKYASIEYERQKRMYKQNATSLNNVQIWEAKQEEAKAGVDKAIADAEIAAINYSYTKVFAPFYGRIGRHFVDIGNLVGNSGQATKLATIDILDPIYVYFNLNEIDIIKIRDALSNNGVDLNVTQNIPVQVKMHGEKNFVHQGQLNFVSTSLNASTGTLEFRALLPNHNYELLPGFFVQVRIPLTQAEDRIIIPDSAILYDQIGAYVLAVNNKNFVIQKRVNLGPVNQGIRVIRSGITVADNIIVSGMHNASPGKAVQVIQGENKIS